MMQVRFSFYFQPQKLKKPYNLSFGSISSFDTFYILLQGGGRIGIGEVTPLPGYNHETVETVQKEIGEFCRYITKYADVESVVEGIDTIYGRAPFMASGIVCAIETWAMDNEQMVDFPSGYSVPMTALCDGENKAEIGYNARRLVQDGYNTLKIKIGRGIDVDIVKVLAVANEVQGNVQLRLDANQRLGFDDAMVLCRKIEHIDNVLVEQPFLPRDFHLVKKLAENTTVPIMLDESIWTENDIVLAKQSGAKAVKLKLCKHKGMQKTFDLMQFAVSQGLSVVFGNGVQTSLGNYLELRIYNDIGLSAAIESNGFAKIEESIFPDLLQVSQGNLKPTSVENRYPSFDGFIPMNSVTLNNGSSLPYRYLPK